MKSSDNNIQNAPDFMVKTEQGDAEAHFSLGVCINKGKGLKSYYDKETKK